MRKIILLLSILFCSIVSFSQGIVPRSGVTITAQDARSGAKYNFYVPHTHGLTLNGGLDSVGAVIYEDSSQHFWYRDTVLLGGHKWTMILKPGDGLTLNSLSGTSPIVYNNLTGNFSCPSCGTGGGGINLLNGLNATTQTFSTGTAGTDFNILSSGSVHTFNFPNASASNRGLLTTADWTSFNSKQSQLNGTGFVKASGTTISYDNSTYYLASNPNNYIGLGSLSALSPATYNNGTGSIGVDTTTGITKLATQAYVLAHQASGTLTGAGNLAPLFTTSVVSNTLVFTASNAGAHTYFGNNGGSPAGASFLTNTQVTADLNLFTNSLQGLVPASGGGTTNFLAANGTWIAPGGLISSVSNSDGTLTISPTTGAVVASLALGHANTWSALQTFGTLTTTSTTIFSGLTSSGANDSVLTVDPITGHVHRRSGTLNLFMGNLMTQTGGDTLNVGGTAINNTTLAMGSFSLSITGLPNKSSALSTDSLLIENAAGQWFKLPIVTGGITQLTGDVTAGPGSGSQATTISALAVTTGKIANGAVTTGKLSSIASNNLFGSDGSGNPGAVAIGSGLSLSGLTLSSTGGLAAIPNRNMLVNNSGATAVPTAALLPIYYADQWPGIVGDNTTNCTAGIQNLIDTISKYGGGILQFGAGIYKTTATVTVPNGKPIIIQGSGGPAFTLTPGLGLTKSYGATVWNNASQIDTAIYILANGSWVRDITVMDSIAGATSTNSGIVVDSAYTSGVRNTAVENFNVGVSARGGQFFHMSEIYAVDIHTYDYYLRSYPGLDAGSYHMDECYGFQITSGYSTNAIGVEAPNGGGLVISRSFFGADKYGIDLPWLGFSDIFINDCNFEFCSSAAINVNVQASASGLAHMIIKGNEIWAGTGYHHGIVIRDTAVGAPGARGIIVDQNVLEQLDTAIIIDGNINYSIIGSSNNSSYNVFTPLAVLHPPGGPTVGPVTINYPQNIQQLTESGGHVKIDPNLGANGQITITASDTLDVVNAGFNGVITVNVLQGGSGGFHLVCGTGVYNSPQAHGTSIWLNQTAGHITTIQVIGNGFSTGAITTNITRDYLVGSVPFIDANNAMNEDNANFFYNNTSHTLSIGTNTNNASSILHLNSTTQAFWGPTMNTTQMNAISSPQTGMQVYNTDTLGICDYNGSHWLKERAPGGGGGGSTPGGSNGSIQYNWGGSFLGNEVLKYDSTNLGIDIIPTTTSTTQVNGKGLYMKPGTLATSGTTIQGAPSIVLESQIWNTSGTPASQPYRYSMFTTNTSGATIASTFHLATQNNTTTNTDMFTVVPGTGIGIFNNNPGSALDIIAPSGATFYNLLIRLGSATGNFTNLGPISTSLGALAFNQTLTSASAINFNSSGSIMAPGHGIFGTQTDPGTTALYSLSGSLPQAILAFDGTHKATLAVNSGGGLLISPTGVTVTLVAPVPSAATLNMPVGTKPTSMNDGDFAHSSTHLYFHDATLGDVDLLGAVSPTLQNVLTNGSTLTGNATIMMATHTWYFSGGVVGINTTPLTTTNLALGSSSAGASSLNLEVGGAVTSPNQGDLYATTGHLFYRDQTTTYDLLSAFYTTNGTLSGNRTVSGGGASLTLGTSGSNLNTLNITTTNGTFVNGGSLAIGGATYNSSSALLLPASTSSLADINFASGTDPTSPNNGSIWYNGINLWFYNNIAKKDLIPTKTEADFTGLAGNATLATFTPAAAGTYRVGGYITITAIAGDVIQMQVTWTDETSTSRTLAFIPMGLTSAGLATTGATSFPTADIRVKSGTAITVSGTLTTGTGSITYDGGASIQIIQ